LNGGVFLSFFFSTLRFYVHPSDQQHPSSPSFFFHAPVINPIIITFMVAHPQSPVEPPEISREITQAGQNWCPSRTWGVTGIWMSDEVFLLAKYATLKALMTQKPKSHEGNDERC
jgi:hypothetical protein